MSTSQNTHWTRSANYFRILTLHQFNHWQQIRGRQETSESTDPGLATGRQRPQSAHKKLQEAWKELSQLYLDHLRTNMDSFRFHGCSCTNLFKLTLEARNVTRNASEQDNIHPNEQHTETCHDNHKLSTLQISVYLSDTLSDIKELKCDSLITSRPKYDNRVQGRKIKLAPEQRKQQDEPFVHVYERPHTKGKEEKHKRCRNTWLRTTQSYT